MKIVTGITAAEERRWKTGYFTRSDTPCVANGFDMTNAEYWQSEKRPLGPFPINSNMSTYKNLSHSRESEHWIFLLRFNVLRKELLFLEKFGRTVGTPGASFLKQFFKSLGRPSVLFGILLLEDLERIWRESNDLKKNHKVSYFSKIKKILETQSRMF